MQINKNKAKIEKVWKDLEIQSYQSVSSTNDLAKSHLRKYPRKEALIVTNHQSAGRGRSGRQFYSKLKQGLYFSLALRVKENDAKDLTLYTIAAASAMIQALEESFSLKMDVKWVNDLFYKGKKVAGILTEAITNPKKNTVDSIVIGIGVNLSGSFKDADEKIQETAACLFEESLEEESLENLLVSFLEIFKGYHSNLQKREFLSYYEEHLLGLNEKIYYYKKEKKYEAWIRGINRNGELIVENEEAEIQNLFANEIHFSSQQFASNRGN